MHPGIKSRVSFVLNILKFTFHWCFIPTIIYLGFKQGSDPGMPQFTPLSLLWE